MVFSNLSGCKQAQNWFTKQAWQSPETHGKIAAEAIYKEMQGSTKDKEEEENLVQKDVLNTLLTSCEGQAGYISKCHTRSLTTVTARELIMSKLQEGEQQMYY